MFLYIHSWSFPALSLVLIVLGEGVGWRWVKGSEGEVTCPRGSSLCQTKTLIEKSLEGLKQSLLKQTNAKGCYH